MSTLQVYQKLLRTSRKTSISFIKYVQAVPASTKALFDISDSRGSFLPLASHSSVLVYTVFWECSTSYSMISLRCPAEYTLTSLKTVKITLPGFTKRFLTTGSYCKFQAGLKAGLKFMMILLPQPPKGWYYRHASLYLTGLKF